jgi:hypothetical protein
MPGQRGCLRADALLDVAVRADAEDPVVLHLRAEMGTQPPLGNRHPHPVGEALPKRPRGQFDAGSDVRAIALGVAGSQRSPHAKALELVEREVIAAEVQHRVEQHRAVACGEHKAVAIGPRRVLRVVAHKPGSEQVAHRRHRHRHARVAGVGPLYRVHRQHADRVDTQAVDVSSRVCTVSGSVTFPSSGRSLAARRHDSTAAFSFSSLPASPASARGPTPPNAIAALAVTRW